MATELRVHGVSGTPPEELLDLPKRLIERKSGDDQSGFYRAKPVLRIPGERPVEAYSWGKLTSGPASRAVWLLFVPFILVNLAHWMLPAAHPESRTAACAARASVRLLRLLGLSLTLTLMLAAALTVMDITAWQYGGLPYGGRHLGPLSFLTCMPPGCRLALSALPVAVMIGGIVWIGRARRGLPTDVLPDPAVVSGKKPPLTHEKFWVADTSVIRLRACHVMAWASGLAAVALAAPTRYGHGSLMCRVPLFLNVVIFVGALLVTSSTRVTGRGGKGAKGWTRWLRCGEWLSVAVLAGSLAWTAWAPACYPCPPTHLPGLRGAIYGVLIAQALLLAGLFVTTLLARTPRPTADFRAALGGFAAPITATIAWLFGGGFSAGVALLAARYLGTPVASTTAATAQIRLRDTIAAGATGATLEDRVHAIDAEVPLIVPPPLFWAAVVLPLLLLVLALAGVGLWLKVVRPRARAGADEVLRAHPADTSPESLRRAAAVASARAWAAAATRLVIPLVGAVTMLAVIVILLLLAVYLLAGFQSLLDRFPGITQASSALLAAAAGGLVAVTIWAFRNRRMRRTVGILWDVATFWPRANHPLTPPCYGEVAVPQLRNRLATLISGPLDAVVVAAHSQGSIIAAATVLQPDPPDRVALLTFGSPLRRIYARVFPAYFGAEALQSLDKQLPGRWVNLWALSDPVGAWVLHKHGGTVDRQLLDVTSLRPHDDETYPPICWHSGFWHRPEYGAAVAELASVVPSPDQA